MHSTKCVTHIRLILSVIGNHNHVYSMSSCHLSIKVDFPNPLSPATIRVNSNPGRRRLEIKTQKLCNQQLRHKCVLFHLFLGHVFAPPNKMCSFLTFFDRLPVHLVGQVGKAHIPILLLEKWQIRNVNNFNSKSQGYKKEIRDKRWAGVHLGAAQAGV